jgi:hypothetical protein
VEIMAERMRDRDPITQSRDRHWPSLFGRATLLAADRRLNPVLVALRAACNRDPRTVAAAYAEQVRDVLSPELGIYLAEHFEAEESDDYFGAIAREAPWLGREITGMKDEHRRLLALLARLVLAAARRERPKVLAHQAQRITALLQMHERKEGHLLRRFFLADDAT